MIFHDRDLADAIELAVRRILPKQLEGATCSLVNKKRTLEVETKIDVRDLEDATQTLVRVAALGVLSWNLRNEIHELYPIDDDGSLCKITFPDSPTVWLKVKRACRTVESLEKLPFIVREGMKYKAGEYGFDAAYRTLGSLQCLRTFNKRCINVFFPYADSVFSLSFSLAQNDAGFAHFQMEFEHEGTVGGYELTIDEIMRRFDGLFSEHLPDLIARLNTVSKLQSLRQASDG